MYKHKTALNKSKNPTPGDWHRADIIAAVRKTGTSIQRLSIDLGYSRRTLGNALNLHCPKYERLIAERLGVTPQTIWPSRYHQDGTSKGGRGERGLGKFKTKSTIPSCNNTRTGKSRNVYQINNQAVKS